MSGVRALEMRFPLPNRAISVNEAHRMHWAVQRRALAAWRDEMGYAWLSLPLATRAAFRGVPCRVQVTIPFRTDQRRDPHNYVSTICKSLVDQLVAQGVWPDDTTEWVSVDEPVCVKGGEVIVRLVPRSACVAAP